MDIRKTPAHKGVVFRFSGRLKRLCMPKTLLVALTNNNCDVLDDRLQRVIPVLNNTEDVWIKLIHAYQWLEIEEDSSRRAHLHDTHADMVPASCHGQFKYGATLCRMGSVYGTFPLPDREHEWQRMRL